MKWKTKLLKKLRVDLQNDNFWTNYFKDIDNQSKDIAIHLAIFSAPLLEKLLEGEKVLESRFSNNKISPFGKIKTGDIVVVKKSGGPVMATFITDVVTSYSNLTPIKVEKIRNEHSLTLGLSLNDPFWNEKTHSKYATIIGIKKLTELPPFLIEKKDRTGWVIVKTRTKSELFAE